MSKRFSPMITATAAALAGSAAFANTLDPELETLIARLGPKDKVEVIIRCADRVRKADYDNPNRALKRQNLIKGLKAKTTVCQRLVEKGRFSDEHERPLWLVNGVAVTLEVKRIRQLARRKGVDTIYLNKTVVLPHDELEPVVAGQPGSPAYTFWNISDIRVTDLWAMGHYGLGVVVGTMDTGADPDHLDLASNWRGGDNSWFDPSGEHAEPFDADGHGTGVLGVILGGNSTGVDMGAAPGAKWIAAKVFDDTGTSNLARIHEAYQWMLDPDGDPETDDAPHIVNNSWVLLGSEDRCQGEFASDIALLNEAGIAVVFSAGNFGPSQWTSMEPANNPGSNAVGSVDYYRGVSWNSSRGPSACGGGVYPRLVAPGEGIFTAGLTGGGSNPIAYAFLSGTSFSAPHVAGAMAVLLSAVPDVPREALEAAIAEGAMDLGATGPDYDSGAGYLDAVEAYFRLTDTGGPVDADGDGATAEIDCDDADASVYPGAPEVNSDGIDQDCNGYDLTIGIDRARYVSRHDKLVIWATSALYDAAALRAVIGLDGGGSIDRALNWNAKRERWQKTINNFADDFGLPVSVEVYGPEGTEGVPVEQR